MSASGTFVHQGEMFVLASQGVPGWRVVTPLKSDDGISVLVDRNQAQAALKAVHAGFDLHREQAALPPMGVSQPDDSEESDKAREERERGLQGVVDGQGEHPVGGGAEPAGGGTSLQNANFGLWNIQANTPRQLQLALKVRREGS